MKRVICLSWFKRLLDRLVTEENEESEKASNQNDQHANATEEQEEKERPTFRFPIITDAEIYGWDDDGEITQITKTKNVPTINFSICNDWKTKCWTFFFSLFFFSISMLII